MDWQAVVEVVLGLITVGLGGGGASMHIKHKKHSNGLKDKVNKLDDKVEKLETDFARVDKKAALLENSQKHHDGIFKEIKEDIKYIRKKLDGGK